MGRSQMPSIVGSFLAQVNQDFKACRDRRGKQIPVAKPTSDAEARAMRELGVCKEAGVGLVRYVDAATAVKSFAGFKSIQTGSLGREIVDVKKSAQQVERQPRGRVESFAGDDEDIWERYKWYIIAGGSALVATAAALMFLRRGRGGDGGTDYHDDGTEITIRKGRKIAGILSNERAEVFRQCREGKISSEIVKAVQEKYGNASGAFINDLLLSFKQNGWVRASADEQSGEMKYTVAIRERSARMGSGGFSYQIMEDAFVLTDDAGSRSYKGWRAEVLGMLTTGNVTLDQIREHNPIDKKVLKNFLTELVTMRAVTFTKKKKEYRINAFEDVPPMPPQQPPRRDTQADPAIAAVPQAPASPVQSAPQPPAQQPILRAAPVDAAAASSVAGSLETAPAEEEYEDPTEVIARFMNPAAIEKSFLEGLAQGEWEVLGDALLRDAFGEDYETNVNRVLAGYGMDVDALLFQQSPLKNDHTAVSVNDILKALSLGIKLDKDAAISTALLWSIKEAGWNDAGREFEDHSNYYLRLASLTMGNRFEVVPSPAHDAPFKRLLDKIEFQIPNRFLEQIELHGETIMERAFVAHIAEYLSSIGADRSARILQAFLPPKGAKAMFDIRLLDKLPLDEELKGRREALPFVKAICEVVRALDTVVAARGVGEAGLVVYLQTAFEMLSEAKAAIDGLIAEKKLFSHNLSLYIADMMTYIQEDLKQLGAAPAPQPPPPAVPTPAPQSAPTPVRSALTPPPVPTRTPQPVRTSGTSVLTPPPIPRAGISANDADGEILLSRTDLERADPGSTSHQLPRVQRELVNRTKDQALTQGMPRALKEDLARKSIPPFSLDSEASEEVETGQWIRAAIAKKDGGKGGAGGPPPVPNGDGSMSGPPPIPGQSTRAFDDCMAPPPWRIDMAAPLVGAPFSPMMHMPMGALQMGARPWLVR